MAPIRKPSQPGLISCKHDALSQLEKKFLQHASPTLADIKPSNFFTIKHKHPVDKEEQLKALATLFHQLKPLHIHSMVLRHTAQQTQILLYRPKQIQKLLACPSCQDILRAYGYPLQHEKAALTHLKLRLHSEKEFPHEIGIFLGYPPHDVENFIQALQGSNRSAVCIGSWKAYEKKEQALRCFRRYKQCTHCLCENYQRGIAFLDIVRYAAKTKGSPLATEKLLLNSSTYTPSVPATHNDLFYQH